MTQYIERKVTTFLLETTTKENLTQICKINNTTPSHVLRTLTALFLNDHNFQHMILRQVILNEH